MNFQSKYLSRTLLISVLFYLFVVPLPAYAHLGGGPPFMKVNGKYSQTNPLNQGASTMVLSWDSSPEKYFVNEQITFDIEIPVLMQATTVPQEYAKDIKVRWSIATGDNFENKEPKFEEGSSFSKTFTKPGSYLVITEAKLPADSDYILINSVQVDVLPNKSYSVPNIMIYAGTHTDDPKQRVLIFSDTLSDPSTKIKKYVWDLGDGRLREGTTVDQVLEQLASIGVQTVYHRAVDENGFITDVGFVAENRSNKLQFSPINSGVALPVSVVTYDEAAEKAGKKVSTKLSLPQFVGLALGVFILVGGGWWMLLRKNHESRSKKHGTNKQNRDS